MTDAIPESHLYLLKPETRALAQLALVLKDGTPHVSPLWFDYQDGLFIINTARGRVKDRNLRRDGRVALAIADPENQYRYLGIQGRVTGMTEQGADAHIDKMAKKYIGKDKYPWRSPHEVRVLVTITPDKVHTMG